MTTWSLGIAFAAAVYLGWFFLYICWETRQDGMSILFVPFIVFLCWLTVPLLALYLSREAGPSLALVTCVVAALTALAPLALTLSELNPKGT